MSFLFEAQQMNRQATSQMSGCPAFMQRPLPRNGRRTLTPTRIILAAVMLLGITVGFSAGAAECLT